MDDRLRVVLSKLVSPEFAVKVALLTLPPQGVALKRQVLRNLLSVAPDSLTCTESGRGGPTRNIGTVLCALRALEDIGVVRKCAKDGWGLTPETREIVRDFLFSEDDFTCETVPMLLPKNDRYVPVLGVVCAAPEKSFSISDLVARRCGSQSLVRAVTGELSKAGYLLRRLSDPNQGGHQTWIFQLNPEAEQYARSQLDWRAEAALPVPLPVG